MYQKTVRLFCNLYRQHFVRYLLVGGTTFFIDLGTLVLLHGVLGINLALATTVAYWLSVFYNFTLTRWWTFGDNENKKLHQHVMAYLILLACNYLFTVLFISVFSHFINYAVAKTIAVILHTTWTYYIYKNYIFVSKI